MLTANTSQEIWDNAMRDYPLPGISEWTGALTISPPPEPTPGYHVAKIERGVLGEPSKIKEELEEFLDAEAQGCKIMALVELSDLLGAIDAYLVRHHPRVTRTDLDKMNEITQRAFRNGHRR